MPAHFITAGVVSILACAPLAAQEGQWVSNEPAVRVNAQAIGMREVLGLYADSELLIRDKLERGELKPGGRPAAVREGWTRALQTAIQDALLDQLGAAMRREIVDSIVVHASPGTLPEKRLEYFERFEGDLVRSLRKALVDAAGGETALREELKRKGRTMQSWEASLRPELFRREVLARNLGSVSISAAAARAYYDGHPGEFRRAEAWRLRRIRIPKAKFSSPELAAQAAAAIKKKLDEGQDFAALAAALHYDPPYDEKGGLLSVDGKSGLPGGNFPLEERIAAKLQDGACSEPLEAGDAFVLVKREGFRPAVVLSFEESADRAAALAFEERVAQRKQEFFEKRKKEAFIEILKKDPPDELLQGR